MSGSRFLVPRYLEDSGKPNFAEIIETYLNILKIKQGHVTGRFLLTGTDAEFRRQIPMGKNIMCKIPQEVAELLNKENKNEYRFLSFQKSVPAPIQQDF